MKLPEDPKERTQILVLIGIMSITVIAVLVMFVIKPQMTKKAKIKEERALIEDELSSARKDIARMIKGRTQNHEILEELVTLSDHGEHILQPRFGRNYLLVAKQIVQRYADKVGVDVQLREQGFSGTPRSPRITTEAMLKYYNLQIIINNGGLHNLLQLIKELESSSPYLSVVDVSVATVAGTPGAHNITMKVQWPVWDKEGTAENLKLQVAEMNKVAASSRNPANKIKTD